MRKSSPMMRYLAIAGGIVAFAILMALRQQMPNVALRATIAAIAGACVGAVIYFAGRR